MVTKSNKQSNAKGKKGKVKILTLNKESVKDLTNEQKKQVQGGVLIIRTKNINIFPNQG
jgi:hypothetical protein